MHDPQMQTLSRTSNGKKIAAEKAGMAGKDGGFIKEDLPVWTIAFNAKGTFGALTSYT